MKVSEKSLEINIGAELLGLMRNLWGMPKAYLRGLTQREEKQEGVDFFAQLDPATRLFAFQFKAPKGNTDAPPYRYTLVKDQHTALFTLAQTVPNSVFYVLPFYVTYAKLQQDVPGLVQDTWLLGIDQMPAEQMFGTTQSKVVRCQAGQATINPDYGLLPLSDISHTSLGGVPAREFAQWYGQFRELHALPAKRRHPWLARGLRVAIVAP